MSTYVLVNRRAGKFTAEEKIASRATVAHGLSLLSSAQVLEDFDPADALARRVVVLEANDAEVARIRAGLSPDAILEPLIERQLHRRRPVELRGAIPTVTLAAAANYQVTIRGGGKPLGDIEVMFYVQDASGQMRIVHGRTDAAGQAGIALVPGQSVSFVEPIPYSGFWITLAERPASGAVIDCPPIAKAGAGGVGWWHERQGANSAGAKGAGIRVGVIDTGCGPHPNLAHVTLVGAFIDGQALPPAAGADVEGHGSHTSGIIGARPTRAGDYAGLAPDCDLFHVRVFPDADRGATQADIIKAVDALSRDQSCDLINLSLGGGPVSQAEEDAFKDAAERGTLCLCSAGNAASPVEYPAAYAECVAVSAVGLIGWAPPGTFSAGNRPQDPTKLGADNLFLASFSCFGPEIDCAGPGVGIVSTVPDRGGQKGLYMEMDGTSMASPAACGALAVVLSRDASYATLPRDISRYRQARLLLAQHSRSIGLAARYEGRGLAVAA